MRPKKALQIVAAIAAFLTVWLVLEVSPSRKQEVLGPINLPDGTSMTVQKVTLGTEHRVAESRNLSKLWEKLASYLPPGWGRKLGVRPQNPFAGSSTVGDAQMSSNVSLALWLYRTECPSNLRPEDTYLEVTDETGVVHLPPGTANMRALGTNSNSDRMEIHKFEAFPRRAKVLTFQVYSVGVVKGNRQFVHAGAFRLPNPMQGPFSVWKTEPLPAKRVSGDLEFSLLRLVAKTNTATKIPSRSATNLAGTEAVFMITRHGAPALDWQVESLRVRDCTDNLLKLWAGAGGVSSNGFFFVPRFWLAPGETWKVQAEFSHTSNYGPEEIGTLENVPIDFNNQWPESSSNRVVVLKGKSLRLGNLQWWPNWGGNAAMELTVTPASKDFRIKLVKATDQGGEQLALARPPPGYGDFKFGRYYFGLTIPTNASSLNLTFAYAECRFAEFVAKPEAVNADAR